MPRYSSISEHFFDRVEFTDSCWLWMAATTTAGYGQFSYHGRLIYAHRAAYEFCVGPIPPGLEIDHLCRIPRCVNPDHMEAVTSRVNTLRGVGPAAMNARKTHCKHGHKLEGNVYITAGYRDCKTCRKQHSADYRKAHAHD